LSCKARKRRYEASDGGGGKEWQRMPYSGDSGEDGGGRGIHLHHRKDNPM